MVESDAKIYSFGGFQLDGGERILFKGSENVNVSPKVFDTLLMLVQNSGHVLSKERMLEEIWESNFVEENNLAQNISLLRRVLGETSDMKFIETVPKYGYRFIAAVNAAELTETKTEVFEQRRARIYVDDGTGVTQEILSPSNVAAALSRHKPETHYAQNGEVNIAYQVVGNGPIDVVFVMGWISHLEYFWEEPHFASFLDRLASFSRLILFDKRGTGLSDRVPVHELPTLEQRMDDVRAVMEAVGSERAALIGVSEGGPMCSLFAATYPEKTIALVMIGTYAKRIYDEDYPWAPTAEERQHFYDLLLTEWGGPVGIDERAPSMADNSHFRDWWATYLRMGASPGAALALTKMNAEIDVRQVLPTVRVPTLVIHRTGDMCLKAEEGRYVAASIPGSKYVELPGVDHLPFVGDQDSILDEVEEFLTGVRHAPEHDRVLATVLFTRIVDFATQEESEGESRRRDLIERHQSYMRRQLEHFKGREIEMVEDGLLAAFDGPARAIRCACAISDSATRLGISLKAGLHTGECDVIENKVGGIAVAIGAGVAARARLGEVLVSNTVKDLVAGSGIGFEARGSHILEGIPGEWRLFAVEHGLHHVGHELLRIEQRELVDHLLVVGVERVHVRLRERLGEVDDGTRFVDECRSFSRPLV